MTFFIYTGGDWKPVTPATCQGERALAAIVPSSATVEFVREFVRPIVIERDGPIFMLEGMEYARTESGELRMSLPAFPGFEGTA